MNKIPLFGTLLCAAFAGLLCLGSTRPARAFDDDHRQTINGTTLHFRVRGTDKHHPYLLLLHGGPGFSAAMFYPWGPRLESVVNVVYLDQRGTGQSARMHFSNPFVPTVAEARNEMVGQQIADIEGVRQALHINKWYVLGHSWGGMRGLEYVSAHPEHVRGYIHMDGLVSVPAMTQNILDNAQAKFAEGKQAHQPGTDALLAQTARLRALPQDNPERLMSAFGLALGPAELYFARDQAASFAAFNAHIADAVRPYHLTAADLAPAAEPGAALIVADHFLTRDDTPLLAKIDVPTLIIQGKQDGVVSVQSAQSVHAGIKNSQFVLLNNCGHFPFADQPDAAAAAVLAFVSHKPLSADPEVTDSSIQVAANTNTSQVIRPCVVSFVVSTEGRLTQIAIKQSSGSAAFDKACVAAIKNGRGQPAVIGGIPYATRSEWTFSTGGN